MEYYRKELEEYIKKGITPSLINGKLSHCMEDRYLQCIKCDFYNKNKKELCSISFIKWLMAEYEPPKPKLTKRERALCEAFKSGWICKDADSDLGWFKYKPIKVATYWDYDHDMIADWISMSCLPAINELFQFISWSDEEPWSIEDLLELEVEGN
jgi:hypothetical protein